MDSAQRVLRGALLLATAAALAAGFATHHHGVGSDLVGVSFGVAAAWAVAAFLCAPTEDPPALPVLALAALAAAAGLAISRSNSGPARDAATVLGVAVTALWFHWLLGLPSGRLASPRRREAAWTGYAVAIAGAAGLVAAGHAYTIPIAATAFGTAAVVSLPALRDRYRGCASPDRDRLRWLIVGVLLAGDVAVVVLTVHALVGWPAGLADVTAAAGGMVAVAVWATGSTRLIPYGGRVLVLVVSITGFTLVTSAVYLVVVLGLGQAPQGSTDREALGLSMVAAAIAAVGYIPARQQLTRTATRLVYGDRQAPDEVMRTFGSRLTRAVPMDELLLQLAESLTQTMGLTRAEIYTGAGRVLELAASEPDTVHRSLRVGDKERPVITRAGVSGNAWIQVWLPALLDGVTDGQVRVAPIRNAGELLGLLVVERPAQGDAFSEDDDRVLADLAREVGLAFHNVQLDAELQNTLAELRAQAAELRESRARIVASGDAERRWLERNLHDGAQQNLVALAVNLRLARDLLATDPGATSEILDGLTTEVQATVQQLRELAHGIYPPLLVDEGLGPALRSAAGRNPLDVSVETKGIGRYPADVEAAVYFCCLEALQNAAKHAPDSRVTVRIWEQVGVLLFEVGDDGPGFDPQAMRRGHGFVNMSDRVGAIGGSVRWDSAPGAGVRIQGSIPLSH